VIPGGDLEIAANLLADGETDGEAGDDGGFVSLGALGLLHLAESARIQASGGTPDGFGGVLTLNTGDVFFGRLTPLDGDILLQGTIDMRAPGEGIGGEVDATAGRDAFLDNAFDLSGGLGGGEVTVLAGRDVVHAASLDVSGRGAEGTGGSVELHAGTADLGTLNVTTSIDASGNGDDADADLVLAGCQLVVDPGVTVDGSTSAPTGGGAIDLIARHAMTLGPTSRYDATPGGPITLVYPPTLVPVLTGAIFDPLFSTDTGDLVLLPSCPVCGDGIRQLGETCDNGEEADGACCNEDCSAFVCPTPTRTATPTPTPTGPFATDTPTPTPTVTATATPGTVTPTATPTPLVPELKPVTRCARTLGKAVSTLVLADLATLEQCGDRAFRCVQAAPPGDERSACLESAAKRCTARITKLEAARARFGEQLAKDCGGDPPDVPLPVMRDPDTLAFAVLEPTCQAETGLALTSHGAITACVQLGGSCAVEDGLGVALPRLADLLGLLVAPGGSGFCLPNPLGNMLGLDDPNAAKIAPRCQRTLVSAARQIVKRRVSAAGQCVEKLLKCRLTDAADPCTKAAERCAAKFAALDDAGRGLRAKLVAKADVACAGLDASALGDPNGLGFDGAAARCAELGETPLTTPSQIAGCVAHAYECAAANVVRHALPGIDVELARVGLSFGAGLDCN
jgi:hypothetical protein